MNNFSDYTNVPRAIIREDRIDLLNNNRRKAFRVAYSSVIPLLRKAKRVLDFGCGSADILLILRGFTNAEIWGYDVSASQIKIAEQRINGTNIRCTNHLEEISGTFDVVFCSHVVEHIEDCQMADFLMKIRSLMAPDGRLIMATPNGLNPVAYTYYMSTDRTHQRMHSPFSLAEYFLPVGLRIESVHREAPVFYDFMTLCKTAVWWIGSFFLKLYVLSVAGGVRGLRYPLSMAATFYVVAERTETGRL